MREGEKEEEPLPVPTDMRRHKAIGSPAPGSVAVSKTPWKPPPAHLHAEAAKTKIRLQYINTSCGTGALFLPLSFKTVRRDLRNVYVLLTDRRRAGKSQFGSGTIT